MSAPHDPWKDILAGWCGNPWEPTRLGVAGSYGWCAHCGASQQVHDIGTIHAADAARHQAEIAALKECCMAVMEMIVPAVAGAAIVSGSFGCGEILRHVKIAVVQIATLRATVDQQAETIRQLQATLPELHDAIERQSAQIAALTQERDEEARAFKRAAKDRDICRQKRVDLEAHCATLTAALEEVTRDMDRAGGDGYGMPECPWCRLSSDDDRVEGYSHDATCELVKARAALAAAPQGDKS